MDNQKYRVVLNIYDLSQGMAKQFSPIFLGKQIDAIYHTGIVVYGKEYYFGGGICGGTPKQTLYGFPIEEMELGETEIPQCTFEEFLRSISSKYTVESYDLFKNNCNNFTNECAQFLVGKNIPENITGLPQEFLNTQLGQMLKPLFEQITNKQANDQTEHFNVGQPIINPQPQPQQPIFLNTYPQPQPQPQQQPKPQPQQQQQQQDTNVQHIDDLETFFCLIESSQKCVIDFYTDWCGPCKTIKPIFNKLSLENTDINFYCVNIDKVREISENLQVTSIPTFIIYENGQQKDRWSGGNQQQLINKISSLK